MKNKRVFIKGFDKDLKCRDFQFEIGKEYKKENNGRALELCSDTVFHFCDSLAKVHNYYDCTVENNRYCIIEPLGGLVEDEEKSGSDHIRIVRELTTEELQIAKGLTGGNTGLFNSGYMNSGDRNSGYRNSGYMNSGYKHSGDRNSGYRNSGDRNSGDRNSGYMNSGYKHSGDMNSGYMNSGDMNSGYRNSGDMNSGYRNSGVFNKTNNSNGVFCNIEPKICIFNIQTDWTLEEFYNSKYWDAINSSPFDLTEWVYDENPNENGVDGKLIVNSYEDTCRRWWKEMDKQKREIIKSIPNFNVDVFCEITGIDKKDV